MFLAQALAKGDRDELAVQASTELGVDGVIPWSAARSIARWDGAKVAKRTDRWRAIVREASRQSLRAWVPDVLELVTTKQLAAMAAAARMLVLELLRRDAARRRRTRERRLRGAAHPRRR